MEPTRYMLEATKSGLAVFEVLCKHENLKRNYIFMKGNDAREILRRLIDEIDQCSRGPINPKKKQYLDGITDCLRYMRFILNMQAHNIRVRPEMQALALASLLEMLREHCEFSSDRSFDTVNSLRESLFEEVFAISGPQPTDDELVDTFTAQIEALFEKLVSIENALSKTPKDARLHFTEAVTKREALEKLRSQITEMAKERGFTMANYHHLLQTASIDQLIGDKPNSLEELKVWARARLASYEKNKRIIDRQIERWGDQVLEILR